MIRLLLLLCFLCSLSTQVHAGTLEAEVSYLRINQKLFGTIDFPMEGASLGLAYVHRGFGLRGSYGKSTETANSIFTDSLHYSNKINSMYSLTVFYRKPWGDKWGTEIGFGKTDYKSTWKVNGVVPDTWGNNSSDSDWSYYSSMYYNVEPRITVRITYADWYRKHKVGYGKETTRGVMLGIIYKF